MSQDRRTPLTARAMLEPAGGLIGGIAGGVLGAFLEQYAPGLANVLMAALGTTGAEAGKAFGARVIGSGGPSSDEEIQRVNHHLQAAFQEACDEALVDIGGRACFPERWAPRELPADAAFDLAALAPGEAALIGNVLRQLSLAATREAGGPFPLVPPGNVALASIYTLIDRSSLRSLDGGPDLDQLGAAFVDATVKPWLEGQFASLLGRAPGASRDERAAMDRLLAHLRRHLLPRALTHFNERLKSPERTEAWRAFHRLVLEDVRALSRQLIEGQARLEQGQLAAAQRLDALVGSLDGEALARFARGAGEIIEAVGRADRSTQGSLSAMLDLLVEQNTELQSAQRSLSAIDLRTVAILSHIEQIQQRLGRLTDSWDAAALAPGRLPWEIPAEFRDERFCPYPGLGSFTGQQAAYFFGRAEDIARFFTGFLPAHTGALIGVTSRDSGIGKSSFVAAGLLPAFQRAAGAAGAPLHLLTYTMSGRPDLLADFAETVAAATGASPAPLLEALRRDEGALGAALEALATAQGSRVLLVLDQFEELFARGDPAASRDRRILLDQLVALNGSQAVTALVAGRQSFYGHPDFTDREALVVQLDERRFELGGLKDAQLRRAIEGPLQAFYEEHGAVVRIKEDLIGPLLRDFLRVPGLKQSALPLLQFLLRLLWVEHGRLDYDTYEALGRLANVFSTYAGEVYARLGADARQGRVANAILIGLVQPGPEPESPAEQRPLIRRRLSLRSALVDDPARPEVRAVLDTLANANGRIITQRTSPAGSVAYEITHEVLLERWRLLRELQEGEQRLVIAQRERLLPFAEQWRREGDPVYLYRGSQLAEAETYLKRLTVEPVLDDAISACYQASLEQRRRERRKGWFRIGLGLLGALALAIVASLVVSAGVRDQRDAATTAQATAERQAAEQSTLRESLALAERARAAKGAGEDETAILLALEAALRDDVSTTNGALREALTGTGWQPRAIDLYDDQGTRALAWSPDGSALLAAGSVQLVLAGPTGERIATCPTRRVEHVAWRPDGGAFATAGRDGVITLRRAPDCADLAILRGHGGAITRLSWSEDGSRLLSGAEDSTVRVWDAASGRELLQRPADDRYVRAVELSPLNDRLLVATNSSTQIWGLVEGPPLLSIPTIFAFDARWTADGAGIVVDNKTRTTLYDSRSGAPLASFAGSGSAALTRIPRIALSPDRERLATLDGTTLRLWEVASGRELLQLTGVRDESSQIEWSRDGRRLLTAGGGAMQLWDAGGAELARLPIADSLVSLSPDGQTIATASLNAPDTRLWRSLSTVARVATAAHPDTVRGGAWSPDGRLVATWSEGAAFVWDALSGALVRGLPVADEVADLRWSPDGERILVEDGGVLLLYDAAGDGEPFPLLSPGDGFGHGGRWSGDGSRILAVTRGGVSTWDAGSGAFLQTTPIGAAEASLVELSPDGALAAVADGGGQVRVIRLAAGAGVSQLDTTPSGGARVDAVTWSPDGQRLALASSGTVTTWRVSDGARLAELEGAVGFRSLAWSRDGSRILGTDGQSLAKLWDAESGRVLTTFTGHTGRLSAAHWSPDEARVMTAADDGTVRVWPAAGGEAQYVIEADMSESGLLGALWSPDGGRALVVGRSKSATIDALATADLLAIGACSVGRPLTADELARYSVPEPRRFDFAARACPPQLGWATPADDQGGPAPPAIPVATLFPAPTAQVADLQEAVYSHFDDYGSNRQLEQFCHDGYGALVTFQSPPSSMFGGEQAVLVRRLGRWGVAELGAGGLADPAALSGAGLPADWSCGDPLRATVAAVAPQTPATPTAAPPTPTVTPVALAEDELARVIRREVGPLSYAYDVIRPCRDGLLAAALIEPRPGGAGDSLVAVVSQEESGWGQRFLGPRDDLEGAAGLPEGSPCLGVLFAPWPPASAASGSDPAGDVEGGFVDLVGASASYAEGVLTVVFRVSAIPEQLPFNRAGVGQGQGEYAFGAYIYSDGRPLPQGSRPPADFLLTAMRIGDGGLEGVSSPATLLEGLLMRRDGADGSYRESGEAEVLVDRGGGTITLVSRAPALGGARLLLVATDSGGSRVRQDQVELLLAPAE